MLLVGAPSGALGAYPSTPAFLHAGSYMSWQQRRGERPVIFTPAVSWFLSLASAVTFTTLLPGGWLEYRAVFTPLFFQFLVCLRVTVSVCFPHVCALQLKSE